MINLIRIHDNLNSLRPPDPHPGLSSELDPFPVLKRSQRVPPGGAEQAGRKHRKLVKSDDLGLRVPQERQPLQDGGGICSSTCSFDGG